uniref:Invertebrate defensins family profile domain-containing protein n=1 Tax=Strigamia maritima TaxID=126957 RepID=T1ISR2_STRMM
MKCLIILGFLICMTHADTICFYGGNGACLEHCKAKGGGFCDILGDCKCQNNHFKPKPKSDRFCELGDASCSASCQVEGHFNGFCDQQNNCVCYN